MATWITHLRVAEAFKSQFNRKSYMSYLIGSIAPDSGMLNDDKLTYTPPSHISHFLEPDAPKWKTRNMDFFNAYLSDYKADESVNEKTAFLLGYFHHLFLDNLWGYYIYKPVLSQYKDQFQEDPRFIWEVKKDWYGLDQEYLESHKSRETWNLFNELTYEEDYLDFYPQKAIQEKLKSIKEFYNEGETIQRPCQYLSTEEMDMFINLSVKWIKKGMELLMKTDTEDFPSTMHLLEKNFECFSRDFGDLKKDWHHYT